MAVCRVCAEPIPETASFCTRCGTAVTAAGSPGGPGGAAADAIVWEQKIPLITNPYLVLQCTAIPLGIGIVLGMIVSLFSGSPDLFVLFLVLGGILACLFLVILAALHLVTGGGLLTTFAVSRDGVAYSAGSTTRTVDRAVTAVSALAGSAGSSGAGLLAITEESSILGWDDIRSISSYPRVRSVVLRPAWLIGPVVLYCTEENYPCVLSLIRNYARNGAARGLDS